MRDFTLDIYRELLETLQAKGYTLLSYADYCQGERPGKFVIMRHDVDAKPENSLQTAQIERSIGAKASYYFRTPESGCYKNSKLNFPDVIRGIVHLGHEIGYHYEDMSLCNGDIDKAWSHFRTWLEYFRRYYAVVTVCMHGAPTSRWDSKALWQTYDYKTLGLIGEPYIDTDFLSWWNDCSGGVLYLTDTGRCWDGYQISVRDKIPQYQDEWTAKGLTWHTTPQLIEAIHNDRLPAHVMLTTHPQRWTNNTAEWYKEILLQNAKNCIKRMIVTK